MIPILSNVGRLLNCLGRFRCFLLGHRWGGVREICHRSLILTHMHVLAGCEATCTRCGHHFRDTCGGTSPGWKCQP